MEKKKNIFSVLWFLHAYTLDDMNLSFRISAKLRGSPQAELAICGRL